MTPVKIKTYVLDDEPIAIDILTQFISRTPILELAGASTNPQTARDEIIDTRPDLLFLDIKMPVLTGFDVIDSFDNYKPLVILTTAYPEYALDGFDYQVLDYLLKPIPFERFIKSVKRAEEILRERKSTGNENEDKSIFIKADGRNVRLYVNDIFNIEGYGDYIKIFNSKNSPKYLLARYGLDEINGLLPSDNFIRIHRSHIVNSDKIESLNSSVVKLINGIEIPIGKTFKKKVRAFLDSRLRNETSR